LKHTLGSALGELAIDDEGAGVMSAGGQSARRKEREKGFPSNRRSNQINPSANEVPVELQGGGFDSEYASYGTQVQFLVFPRHYLCYL